MGKVMSINKQLSDLERVQLTKKAYEKLKTGQTVMVNKKLIGTVVKTIYAADGMQAFVLANQDEITILFKGSFGLLKGNPTTWHDEWLKTNLPLLVALLLNEHRIPSQLKTAARFLNRTVHQFQGAQFYIYGHSLGAINAQYALANCRHPEQIRAAYLYEGTNIWQLLNGKQRQCAGKMRQRIYNYVDIYDPVTLGLTASHHLVGQLRYVDSPELKQPIKQHMWGGYSFDQAGNLKLKKVDDAFLEASQKQRHLLTHSRDFAGRFAQMRQKGMLKIMAQQKLNELVQKYPDHKSLSKIDHFLSENLLNNDDE